MLNFYSWLLLALTLMGCTSQRFEQQEDLIVKVDPQSTPAQSNLKIDPVLQTKAQKIGDFYQLAVSKYQLPNGLRVLVAPSPKIPIAHIHIFYGVGSKHEPLGQSGSSHFLEHMMFKGAKRYGKGVFDDLIEGVGGVSNAYTSFDNTVYHQSVPKQYLKLVLDMEADRMENLLVDAQDFVSEKQVVLEEKKMRYENSPQGQLWLHSLGAIFQGTPYGIPVIGKTSDIINFSREKMLSYFKEYYSPNNAILVVVGDVDPALTMEWINQSFGHVPASQTLNKSKQAFEEQAAYAKNLSTSSQHFVYGQSPLPIFALNFKARPLGSRQAYAGDFISLLLAGNQSSYLEQKYVRHTKPQLTTISSMNYNLAHSGFFTIQGDFFSYDQAKKFGPQLKKDLTYFCDQYLNEEQLQKARNQVLKRFYDQLGSGSSVAEVLGSAEMFTGDFRNYLEEVKTYLSLTLPEVKQECQHLFAQPHHYLVIGEKYKKKMDF